MKYDYPLYRPPSEASSLVIQATIGCPHNKCTFCFMYKGKKFKLTPLSEILEQITNARLYYGDLVRTIFLADGNSIILPADELIEILNYCYAIFSHLERVTTYGAAHILLRTKTVDELKKLYDSGLKRIHMGLESGDDIILKRICKGANSEEIVKAGRMVKSAGMELSEYVLLGIGGAERWEESAEATASVLNKIEPDFVRVRTLIIRQGAPLYEQLMNGEFKPASALNILDETKLLLEKIDVNTLFYSDHVSNLIQLDGKLPDEKDKLLAKLEAFRNKVVNDLALRKHLEDPYRVETL
ncbi:MAG: radical SAM protein [Candidatus Thermoplasmatota archaeon]